MEHNIIDREAREESRRFRQREDEAVDEAAPMQRKAGRHGVD
jgi:hypothetical protein